MLQDQYLEEDTGWLKGYFNLLSCTVLPVQDLFNILPSDLKIITISDSRLEENPYRVWEPL
jgi:hypothetical protein